MPREAPGDGRWRRTRCGPDGGPARRRRAATASGARAWVAWLLLPLAVAALAAPLEARDDVPPTAAATPAAAPQPDAPERTPPDPAPAGPVAVDVRPVERPPEIHYLPDASGRLVPVPGFRYRDFLELLALKEGLPGVPRPPAVVVERATISVAAPDGADRPTCRIEARLVLRQTRDGWAEAALALGGLVLADGPVHDGPGRFVLERPRDEAEAVAGYRGWVEGAADDRHEVTLVGRIPAESLSDRDEFVLDIPAAAASRVTLATRRADPAPAVQPVALPPRVGPGPDGGTAIEYEGLGGRTRFRVGQRAAGVPAGDALPQVTVESVVRIDGRVALFDAVLRVDPSPADAGPLRVVLPPRCTLVRVREPAVLRRSEPPAGDDATRGTVVEVQPGRRADGAAVVELECERAVDPSGRVPFEPLGFAVAGVPDWRQRGRASLVVAGEWQLDWDDPAPIRRVDPAPAARQPGFVAAFAYDAQPATLPLRLRPRGSRVVVEPEYRFDVAATRITLAAKFRLAVRGAPVGRLAVGLEGWTVDEVGPATIVDAASVTRAGGDALLPFVQPLAGDAVIELRASRAIERGAEALDWSLPQPRADLVGPATVTVAAASDIEVIPDGERIRGLVRQVVPAVRRAGADRGQLVYRLEGSDGTFAATRRFLPRRVDAEVEARVTVGLEETTVEERLRLDVANAALESIDLLLPAELATGGAIEVLQGAQVLSPFDLPGGDGPVSDDDRRAVRCLLAVPLLGAGEISVRFPLATPPAGADGGPFRVPLVLPRAARIVGQSVVVAGDGLEADVRDDAWKRDTTRGDALAQRAWMTARTRDAVALSISPPRAAGAGETVVEAAWFETRLAPDRREDAFSYALSTTASRLVITLPESWRAAGGFAPPSLQVRLGGVPVAAAPRSDGSLAIDIPRPAAPGAARSAVLVRVEASRPWTGVPARDGAILAAGAFGGVVGPLTLEAPRFPEGTIQRRFYWEILHPEDEHVLGASGRWTAQQRWNWWTGGLRREPVVSRAVLAEWVAAAVRGTGVSERLAAGEDRALEAGRALFAGTGDPGTGRVWLVPTWLLVLAVSGPILAIGLLMVYRPTWRRLPAVFALLLPATVAAVIFPAIAPLVIQAAVPGVALSLVAAALRRAAEPPRAEPRWTIPGGNSSTRLGMPPSLVVNLDEGSSTGSDP